MTEEILVKAVKNTKRLGRGRSSGKGKTSGRGMNGQKSRTGSSTKFFEGGQTKLAMRLPKVKGFKSKSVKTELTVSPRQLAAMFKDGAKVDLKAVVENMGLAKNEAKLLTTLKVLDGAKIKSKYSFASEVKFTKISNK